MKRPSFGRYGLPIIAVVLLLVALVIILRGAPDRSMTEPAALPPVAPQAQAKSGSVSGAGVVEPSSELIQVTALVPGVVREVRVVAGDRVVPGQVLMTIDDRDVAARLRQERAGLDYARRALASAEVEAGNARRQAALLAGVADPRAVSEQARIDRKGALEAAEARVALARADVARAQAAVAAAQTEIERRVIRAPRAAEVLQVRTRPGQYVTAGPPPGGSSDPAMTLGETRPLHVRIDVDETEIPRVQQGAPAMVSVRGNARQQVRATFVRLEPLVVPKRSLTNASTERVDVRVLQVIYALPANAEGFFIGQQVDAFIPARQPAAAK
ncbi:efflux RND transporter periplasmic adaptor subunit [Sandaracinobacteroides saxicola]|uniref:HlyD family efflux transporter periplasmic adaptor subunit n=1 Tax=Sandaracinobacteroides saxicola TaxID=2759707 RepID=A0A7G5IKI9_9SPHN|nr:HlyD family efflux transporter periplasmic adaptor subunit [Sandaracinobacteroides saxicola]QMW23881.1 HlyD family efflux transporter periplasmic adaptor subunit [Sandaracinobacteroides saxicola]